MTNSRKILIPHQHKIHVASYADILFFKSDNYYSHVHLCDGRNYLLIKTLSKLEKELQDHRFIRISQSLLVNADHITSIDKKKKLISLGDNDSLAFTVPVRKLSEWIVGRNADISGGD
jgi:DNA-binding LytR/AlgR family response regulator